MKWPLAWMVAASLAAGCQSAQPTFDPFAGRTTVPPPGTGYMAPAAVAQPYYQGAPPPGSAPTSSAPYIAPPASAYGVPQGAVPQSMNAAANVASAEPTIRVQDGVVHLDGDWSQTAPETQAQLAEQARQASQAVRVASTEPAISVPGDSEAEEIRLASFTEPAPQVFTPAEPAMPVQVAAEPLDHAITARQQAITPAAMPTGTVQAPVSYPAQPTMMPTSYAVRPAAYVAPTVAAPTAQPYYVPQPQPAPQMIAGNPCEPQMFVAPHSAIEITQLPQATGSRAASPKTPAIAVASSATASAATSGFVARQASGRSAEPTYRYGFETNYRWIKGKLEYLASSQTWKLRYIPVDGDTDKYGGSVLIANSALLAKYKAGDYVTLEGRISRDPDEESGSFAPEYTVTQVKAIQ